MTDGIFIVNEIYAAWPESAGLPFRCERWDGDEMERPSSIRWMRAGAGMFVAGAVMFACALATAVTHGPATIAGLFIVLLVLCGLAGFILILIGARKGRAENQRLLAQVQARAQRK
jgi:hypothetical protein